ncbi:RSC chromatin remodeling complex subunit RSC8 [Tubulinosema ratisbonensis]|uniref:RSC chromatin remodeling complex subunit RSC8 n=1 Tax=Tubulinosema ratisbonensis TaxID=291195 RepID=A0A437AQ20_9MICR|nr:RSC chromatin remodeling complex subunit RSC8 [Tubulinosema ratisbonensis]
MEENHPTAEKVVFEEIYGKESSDAKPVKHPKETYIFDKHEITCSEPHKVSEPIFLDESKNEISNFILKNYTSPNYLKFTELPPNNYHQEDLLLVFRELELRNLINYKPKVVLKKKEVKIWTKTEKLKLLEGVEYFGDDWNSIEKYVQRSKADCIIKFLKLNLNVTKLIHPNRRMAEVVFLTSRVHPSVGSEFARECLDINKTPNYHKVINRAEEQLILEKKKLDRLKSVLLEAQTLRIKEKVNDFKNILSSVEKEKNEIKEEIIDYEKDIKELNEFIKEMKMNSEQM